jgi:citronellol/citronellal dehydrogenase
MKGGSSYTSVFRPGLFAGQVAIVTGGGSGIGRCTAHELASLGARVALVGRKVEKLDKVKTEIAAAGGEARG